jgi:hypothetical protein
MLFTARGYAERFYLDDDVSRLRLRLWDLFDDQTIEATKLFENNCTHGSPPSSVGLAWITSVALADVELIGDVSLVDAKSRSVLDEGALIGSRLRFCWHFPFRVAQPRDARALYGK